MPFAERVLYEDDDLLVLDKPAGWLMHGIAQRSRRCWLTRSNI
jgi:23S rRNA-/tRNA-specific pseudouridylate synthase